MSMLSVTKKQEGTKLTVEAIGRIDTYTAPQFDNEVSSELEGITDLVIDFSQVEYISSAGLRLIVTWQKAMSAKNGTFSVCHLADTIYNIFVATGLVDFINIIK